MRSKLNSQCVFRIADLNKEKTMIPFKIDGQPVEGKEGAHILEVALDTGIEIPDRKSVV